MLSSGGAGFVDDGGADQVAPLGPRTVIIAHVVVAQQILQHKPGVRTALADAAISDDFIGARNTFWLIEPLKILERLEGAIFVGSLRPRDIRGLGDVSGALCRFRHPWRSDNLSGELIHGTNVYELARFAAFHNGEDVLFVGAEGFVEARDTIGGRRNADRILGYGALFFEPFLAAA